MEKALAQKEETSYPQIHHYIHGKEVAGNAESQGLIYNPALASPIKQVHFGTTKDVDYAVESASKAFAQWSTTPPLKRARVMFKFKELLEKHSDEIISLIVEEHGKVLDDARGELTRGLEVVEFACGIPHLLKGGFSENVGSGVDCHTIHQALGICAGITPFNFPVMVPMWMYPIAIACGNCFILKPSEKNPSASLFCADLLTKAGLPAGVFNVVNGDRVVVDALLNHPKISAISFVGSTPVAKHVYQTASANGKRVQALGGAKNHCVVMPDANLDNAVDGLMGAAYGSAGERCMAISVAVAVGDKIGDELAARLKSKIKDLKLGHGHDKLAQMGPLISKEHLQRVASFIEQGVKEGGKLLVDGRGAKVDGYAGYFLGATLFDQVTHKMKIYQEEIFGPVLCIVRVPDFETAVDLVNGHQYGNGAVLYTQNGEAARQFSTRIQSGMVGINVPIPVPVAFYSFGGWKESRLGNSCMHGPEGVKFYTKLKTISSRWPQADSKASYNMPVSV